MLDVFNDQLRWDTWWQSQISYLSLGTEIAVFRANMCDWAQSVGDTQ